MVGMADATFTAVDLSRLPAPDIIEALDFETVLAGAVAQMRDEMAKSGLTFETRDSDPATKLLQVFAYYAQMLRQRINDAARAVMPAYAVKADLDHIAALFGITRLTITPANPATGAPAVMEDDTDFRRRMVLAPEGYSVAGPEGAYISHTLSADANVLDASATGPQPDDIKALVLGVLADHAAPADLVAAMTSALDTARWPGSVVVSVLARTGDGTAPAELIDTVAAYVSDETRRPLTDWVTVQSARIVPYVVDATLTTFSGPDGGVVLAAAQASLDAYTKASHRLGRDITRSAIFAALSVEGVQNVILREPAQDIVISRQQAPIARACRSPMPGQGSGRPFDPASRLNAAGKGARTGRRAAARCRGGDPRVVAERTEGPATYLQPGPSTVRPCGPSPKPSPTRPASSGRSPQSKGSATRARSTRCWTRPGPVTRPRPGRVSSRSPLASPTKSRWA
jgi:phage-related baseplate assembly protein